MNYSPAILGKSLCTDLIERQRGIVLVIGRDKFDRGMLAGVACFHFAAAANLSRILTAELRVKDTRDVFESVAPDALILPRLGAVSLAVLGAAFEVKGLGGDAPLETWCAKHRGGLITFGALKTRAHVEHENRKPGARISRASRRRR